jgi:hypothetical protein
LGWICFYKKCIKEAEKKVYNGADKLFNLPGMSISDVEKG